MAVGIIFEAPGVTQAQYEQVRNAVAPGNRRPSGMLYHTAGPTETGWVVIETWESQEALDRFFQEKLNAELQRANMPQVQPRIFQVANTMP